MNINTWNKLTEIEKEEIRKLSHEFIKAVMQSNATDGWDFGMKYEIRQEGAYYSVVEKSSNVKLGAFKSKSKNVMEALLGDAIVNYGR